MFQMAGFRRQAGYFETYRILGEGYAMNHSLGPQRLCGRDPSRTPCGNPAGCQRHYRYQ